MAARRRTQTRTSSGSEIVVVNAGGPPARRSSGGSIRRRRSSSGRRKGHRRSSSSGGNIASRIQNVALGGLAYGLAIKHVPGIPTIELEPDVVFLLLLPPILFGAAYSTPIRDIRAWNCG